MRTSFTLPRRWAFTVIMALLGGVASVPAQRPPIADAESASRISLETRTKVTATALQHPRVLALARGQRVRALGFRATEPAKDGSPDAAKPQSAELFLVNYANNQGMRVRFNAQTGDVEDVVAMKGRPQSSAEEQKEAEALIAQDAKLGELLRAGSHAVGGFVVDPPVGTPAEGRYLEYHIASPDRRQIQHKVFVNLASARLYTDAARR